MGFHLRKWYLDCVTPSGATFLGYAAVLRWGLLRLRYASILLHEGQQSRERSAFRRVELPVASGRDVVWTMPGLGVAGRWRGSPGPGERLLWQEGGKAVRWHCRLPLAEVDLELEGRRFQGSGYVEELDLQARPWELPIQKLRWGRFHGGGHAVVWVQWEGRYPLRLVLADGMDVAASVVKDHGFDLPPGGRLELGQPVTLRSAQLVELLLAQLPLLAPLRHRIPPTLRRATEVQWLAPAALVGGGQRVEGIAVHDVVRWS